MGGGGGGNDTSHIVSQIARTTPVAQHWATVGSPTLGHRWQPPVGQRHFGEWANVGPTVACHCWAVAVTVAVH